MNPFAHRDIPHYWIITITPSDPIWCNYYLESLSDLSDVVVIEDNGLLLYFEEEPNCENISKRCHILAEAVSTADPNITMELKGNKTDHEDAIYSHENIITVGSYRLGTNLLPNRYHIRCKASKSFGDGAHPTTYSCLGTIYNISKSYHPKRILDMGCGSGILSLLMARLWMSASITAVDLDPYAVSITKDNIMTNQLQKHITSFISDGYNSKHIHGTYDFIAANLLLNIHKILAKESIKYLNKNGKLLISGILEHQIHDILSLYQHLGLRLVCKNNINGWSALLLEKKEL